MPKPQFHSLRVQVLLWTILPLLIVLLTFSLSGSGSYQVSVRQLMVEENANLVTIVAAAIQARLALYGFFPLPAPAPIESAPPLDVWTIDPDVRSANAAPLPPWVARALAAAAPASAGPWIGLDANSQRLVWVRPDSNGGQLVGSISSRALAIDDLFSADSDSGTLAVVDAQNQIITLNNASLPGQFSPPQPQLDAILDEAFTGNSGVEFLQEDGREVVVAFGPLPGTPWALLIRRPMTDLVAPFFRFAQVLPLILLAASLISFFTLYFGLNLVVRPVHVLIDYATHIGQGEFGAAARSAGGVQEIEELRQALHAMAQLLQSKQAALQDYLHNITNRQEEERARLARELHDETVQTLIALDHKVQLIQRGLDKHPERTREQVVELRKLTALATQEVRRLSYGLRPLGLDEIGLDSALARLAQEGCTHFLCRGQVRRLPAEKELALYRIAQESLSNVRRHAHANCVRMMLVYDDNLVTLGIGDDGVGFDLPPKLSDLTGNGHFGLMGISERIQLIGGQLLCKSSPGRGATIIVQAPYENGKRSMDEAAVDEVHAWLAG